MTLVAGVLRRDASGRISTISPGAAVLFNGGTPVGPAGDLQVVASAGAPSGVPAPTRDYALTGPTLPADIAFTRASVGTYFDAAGVMQAAAIDTPRFDSSPLTRGLLGLLIEEQRTNRCLAYNQFSNVSFWTPSTAAVTANQAVAPDGTNTADLLVASVGSAGSLIKAAGQFPVTAGQSYTQSIYLKLQPGSPFTQFVSLATSAAFGGGANRTVLFDLVTKTANYTPNPEYSGRVQELANGWLRCITTWTPTVTGNIDIRWARWSVNGDGVNGVYVWGAQWEDGSFETSLIKSAGVATVRSADIATITGAAFTAFWNQAEGTLSAVASSYDLGAGRLPRLAAASNNTPGTSSALARINGADLSQWAVTVGGVAQAALSAGPAVANAFVNMAGAYKLNDFAASTNGGAVLTDGVGTVPTVDRLHVGSLAGAEYLNGWIKSIRYWGVRLPNAQMQAATSGDGARNGGLLYNNDGALVAANGGVIGGYAQGGMPVTSDGALCVAYGGTPARFLAGIPFDAAGRVCMAAPVPPVELEAFDISFEDPAFG